MTAGTKQSAPESIFKAFYAMTVEEIEERLIWAATALAEKRFPVPRQVPATREELERVYVPCAIQNRDQLEKSFLIWNWLTLHDETDATEDQKAYFDRIFNALSDFVRQQSAAALAETPESRREQLKTMPYGEYLLTPEWEELRRQKLAQARYRCQLCNGEGALDVHHRTYENRGSGTEWDDLIVLCRDCHAKHHGVEKEAGQIPM